MRADGEDMAKQARLHPLGNALETVVIAEHVADLDNQLALCNQRCDALPLRPACAGRLVVPDMLAGLDNLLHLAEALIVAPLGGDRYDPWIGEHLADIVEPVYA